jgi:hypothetical protein
VRSFNYHNYPLRFSRRNKAWRRTKEGKQERGGAEEMNWDVGVKTVEGRKKKEEKHRGEGGERNLGREND